jgi:muconate cycloisomerase
MFGTATLIRELKFPQQVFLNKKAKHNMRVLSPNTVVKLDAYHLAIPLVQPYHLSKVYGTMTHSNAVIVRVRTESGVEGWGEADPGGLLFTGDTCELVMQSIRDGGTKRVLGHCVEEWVENSEGLNNHGSIGAAFDVAMYDALAKTRRQPLWTLLGEKCRDTIDLLWPTSSGTAVEDLNVIKPRINNGFHTFMLKMGSRSVEDDLVRMREVVQTLPSNVRVMVDANQGWSLEEALTFFDGIGDLPLVLVEQPVKADDHESLIRLRKVSPVPVSVDESLQTVEDARLIAKKKAASVFSIKVSKNGGLRTGLEIGHIAQENGISVLMNSMLELGITQCASLHLGCVLHNILDCGHAYMSTLRMSDDITDFSDFIHQGKAGLPSGPGLGIRVDERKIKKYLKEEFNAKYE